MKPIKRRRAAEIRHAELVSRLNEIENQLSSLRLACDPHFAQVAAALMAEREQRERQEDLQR